MFDFVAFDIETTGKRAAEDEIIEIAAVRFVDRLPAESFATLVRAEMPVPAAATRVHGIRDDMLAGQPALADALERFTWFCGDSILVAHNAAFDFKFLSAAYERQGVAAPLGLVLDSYASAKQALPELFNWRLDTLLKHFGIECADRHRAGADALACGLAFIEIVKAVGGGSDAPFENVCNLSGGGLRFPAVAPRSRQLALL